MVINRRLRRIELAQRRAVSTRPRQTDSTTEVADDATSSSERRQRERHLVMRRTGGPYSSVARNGKGACSHMIRTAVSTGSSARTVNTWRDITSAARITRASAYTCSMESLSH